MLTKLIIKNTGFLFIADIVERLLSTVFVLVLAHYVGVEKFGDYAFAMALCGICLAVTNAGINELMVRDISRDRSVTAVYLSNGLISRFALSCIAFMFIVIVMYASPHTLYARQVVYLFGFALMIDSISGVISSVFRAFENMKIVMWMTIVHRTLIVLLSILALIIFHADVRVVAGMFILGSLMQVVLLSVCLKRYRLPFSWQGDGPSIIIFLKRALPFGLVSIFVILLVRVDTVMLSFIKGNEAVGYYRAAYVFVQFLMIVPSLFRRVFLPAMARLSSEDRTALLRVLQRSVRYACMFSLPIACLMAVSARGLLGLFFDTPFRAAAGCLRVLIWIFPCILLSNILGVGLNATGHEKISAVVTFSTLVVNIMGNSVLIPRFGPIGAALSVLIASVANMLMTIWFVRRKVGMVAMLRSCIRPMLAMVTAGMLIGMLQQVPVIARGSIFIIVYFLALYGIGGVTSEDKALLCRAIGFLRQKQVNYGS